ncbi:uncharacterized protein BO88DRAFT_418269 [Aspergillus vadensis CBS 113365]|uniref:Uncharacterized protein n=1 Tax=Aspergillus vadensis (strain CBS 113365 / IMI 142717 / IBT 24658) TaxID=1448311 RepID=A0A319BIN2_ASPVC|nr:hypothetical protein BO88DRAFT_418269 [Aspergillus vadensis CBS 113365]PYH65613.1 hypothetical protein BO88DRAFT_418269 [Aspergillus vadensis CBS 113365]
MYEPEDTVIADAAKKDIQGVATMAAHVDWHAALSEREVPSIQNPAFSRFCHTRGTPATRLTDWTALDGRDGPQTEREAAARVFIYYDMGPTILPPGNEYRKSIVDVPVNSDNIRPSMPRRESGLARSLPFLTPLADYQRILAPSQK